MVAAPDPGGGVGRGQQRLDLGVGEERDDRFVVAFLWDRGDASDQLGVLGVAQGCVGEHRAQRRQAGVAGAGAVVALVFEVVEEREDDGGVEVLESED